MLAILSKMSLPNTHISVPQSSIRLSYLNIFDTTCSSSSSSSSSSVSRAPYELIISKLNTNGDFTCCGVVFIIVFQFVFNFYRVFIARVFVHIVKKVGIYFILLLYSVVGYFFYFFLPFLLCIAFQEKN